MLGHVCDIKKIDLEKIIQTTRYFVPLLCTLSPSMVANRWQIDRIYTEFASYFGFKLYGCQPNGLNNL